MTSTGQVLLVSLQHGTAKSLAGPLARHEVRTGYGLNLLRVDVQHTGSTMLAVVTVNGSVVLRYSVPARGLQPVTRLVAWVRAPRLVWERCASIARRSRT